MIFQKIVKDGKFAQELVQNDNISQNCLFPGNLSCFCKKKSDFLNLGKK